MAGTADGREWAGWRPRAVSLAAVAVMGAAVYLNTLSIPYLFEDIVEIQTNHRVHTLSAVPSLLVTDACYGACGPGITYRPLLTSSIPPLFVLGGGAVWPFHVANILLHAATSCLLAAVAMRLLGGWVAGLVAGLAFAVHPIHAEAVAWISGRSELLLAATGAAAWWFHLEARKGGRLAPVLAVLFLAASLGSKETALAWPAAFALSDLLFPAAELPGAGISRRATAARGAGAGRFRLPLYAAYGVLILAWLGVRWALLGRVAGDAQARPYLLNSLAEEGWWPAAPFTFLRILALAAGMISLPGGPCFDYGFNQIPIARGPFHPDVLLAALGLAACFLGAWVVVRSRRRDGASGLLRGLLLAGGLFVATWLPVSNLVFPALSMLAERNLYVPSFGWCLAAGLLAQTLRRRAPRPALWLAPAGGLLLIAAAAATVSRNAVFADHLSVTRATAENCPGGARGHFFHGAALAQEGRLPEAIAAYRAAVGIAPDFAEARAEMARALARLGRREEAVSEARRALRARPSELQARLAVAAALAAAGLRAEADAVFEEVRREHAHDLTVLYMQAERLAESGRLVEALGAFEEIRRRFPDNPAGDVGAGTIRLKMGETAAARALFERALRRDPYDPDSIYRLGLMALASEHPTEGSGREAERLFARLTRIQPRNPLAWMRLGQARERLGEAASAESSYRRAVDLAADLAAPRRALAGFLIRQGRREEASRWADDEPTDPNDRRSEP